MPWQLESSIEHIESTTATYQSCDIAVTASFGVALVVRQVQTHKQGI